MSIAGQQVTSLHANQFGTRCHHRLRRQHVRGDHSPLCSSGSKLQWLGELIFERDEAVGRVSLYNPVILAVITCGEWQSSRLFGISLSLDSELPAVLAARFPPTPIEHHTQATE